MDFDKWARVYDIVYGSFQDDVSFYLKEAQKSRGKVLELACGTGRIYLELLKKGVDAYGIDIAGKMLESLREKAGSMGLKPAVKKADMRTFRFSHKFSLIIIPFRSFLHNLTQDDQIKTLRNIRRHLKPGGRLALNFFFPSPDVIANHYGKEIKRTVKKDGKRYTVINKSRFIDEPNQTVKTKEILKRNNRTLWRDEFILSFIYKREFELLLEKAGFSSYKVYGGFNYQPLKSSKQEMVWVVKR